MAQVVIQQIEPEDSSKLLRGRKTLVQYRSTETTRVAMTEEMTPVYSIASMLGARILGVSCLRIGAAMAPMVARARASPRWTD